MALVAAGVDLTQFSDDELRLLATALASITDDDDPDVTKYNDDDVILERDDAMMEEKRQQPELEQQEEDVDEDSVDEEEKGWDKNSCFPFLLRSLLINPLKRKVTSVVTCWGNMRRRG